MNADHQLPTGGVTRRVFIKRTAATALACAVASSLFLAEARAADPGNQCYNNNNNGDGSALPVKCGLTIYNSAPDKCTQAGAPAGLPCYEFDVKACAEKEFAGTESKPMTGGYCVFNKPKGK
jgi:hypothetical protein